MKERVLAELKTTFKPEFLNRIDAVIVFHQLIREQMYSIIDLLLSRVRKQLIEQEISLEIPQDAKDFLVEKGFDQQYGARPLRRTIQNMVEDPMAEGLLQRRFHAGDVVVAVVRDGVVELEVQDRLNPPQAQAALLGDSATPEPQS